MHFNAKRHETFEFVAFTDAFSTGSDWQAKRQPPPPVSLHSGYALRFVLELFDEVFLSKQVASASLIISIGDDRFCDVVEHGDRHELANLVQQALDSDPFFGVQRDGIIQSGDYRVVAEFICPGIHCLSPACVIPTRGCA